MAVVGLGAWCDFVTEDEYRRRLVRDGWPIDEIENLIEDFNQGVSFAVHEFADLADGQRITLHTERGFTMSTGASRGSRPRDNWRSVTLERLQRDVLTTVLPDDAEESQEEHPWEWLAELLRVHGVEATPDELRRLPYQVVFSDRLRARLAPDQ
jgi:hypothetical protein